MRRHQSRLRFALIATALVSGSATDVGAQKWVTNPNTGRCYALTPRLSWTAAEALARKWGGYLATVRNKAEHDWIFQQFGASVPGLDDAYWIGYSDAAKEGTWVWADKRGSPSFTNWYKTQPDNFNGVEHYASVLGPNVFLMKPGAWNDNRDSPIGIATAFPGVVEHTAASFGTFGKGCGSSVPAPILAAKQVPVIGRPFSIQVANLKSPSAGLLLFGDSDKKWNGVSLPLNVSPLGMPGCSLLVSWDIEVVFLLRTGSTLTWNVSIPVNPALCGRSFYVQAWVLDTKANPLGVATSNGGKGTIGS